MEKLFRGVMNYRSAHQKIMVEQLKNHAQRGPIPTAVFVTCVDTRLDPAMFTQTEVGEMFIARNAGNIVPHSSKICDHAVHNEPALLELACTVLNVKNVVVCGHSDCKAVNLLHSLHADNEAHTAGPLRSWVTRHGECTMAEFDKMEADHFRNPILLHGKFPAFIDVDNKFSITDKLSMVHTLMQMQNVSSYPFMQKCIKDEETNVHAMWFDVTTGEVHIFSAKEKTFIPLNEKTVESLCSEMKAHTCNEFCSHHDVEHGIQFV